MSFPIRKVVAFLILIMTLFQASFATVYEVGDSAGWTLPIFNIVDYNEWASNKTFHVGDVVVFSYNKLFHNVRQVNQNHYQSCNATSPIAAYSSGNDSIPLEKLGHYYFICGVPGHCQIGQKVDINVTAGSPGTSPSAATSPLLSTSTP